MHLLHGVIPYSLNIALFAAAFIYGLYSLNQAKQLKGQIAEEKAVEDEINKWLDENMRGKTIEYGILINQTIQMSQGDKREFALLGNSDLTLDVFDVCDITIRHGSKIHLKVHDGCFVYVSMHDDSVLDVVSKEGTGRVCVSHFGGSVINGGLIDKFNEKL